MRAMLSIRGIARITLFGSQNFCSPPVVKLTRYKRAKLY